jgi:hypothetical protein
MASTDFSSKGEFSRMKTQITISKLDWFDSMMLSKQYLHQGILKGEV